MHLRDVVLFTTTLLAIVNPISSAVLFATRVMGILVSATAFGLLGRGIGGLLPGLAR